LTIAASAIASRAIAHQVDITLANAQIVTIQAVGEMLTLTTLD
jgi:hypothetical protein